MVSIRKIFVLFLVSILVYVCIVNTHISRVYASGLDDFPLVSLDVDLEEKILDVIQKNPDVVFESIQRYITDLERETYKKKQMVFSQMRENPYLAVGTSPITGAEHGDIVLLEFSDFQCPFCEKVQAVLDEFVATHSEKVTLVYKHFPLTSIHSEAENAAKASWAAGQQGKFWEYRKQLFSRAADLDETLYLDIAQDLNLNFVKFAKDYHSDLADSAIKQDIDLAKSLDVQGTPFFLINGIPLRGVVDLERLEDALQLLVKGVSSEDIKL